jgi:hypothetical protein
MTNRQESLECSPEPTVKKDPKKIRVKVVGRWGKTAYIALPGHRHEPGIVKKSVRLGELIKGYKGPWVMFDFDKEDCLIGIEIIIFSRPYR